MVVCEIRAAVQTQVHATGINLPDPVLERQGQSETDPPTARARTGTDKMSTKSQMLFGRTEGIWPEEARLPGVNRGCVFRQGFCPQHVPAIRRHQDVLRGSPQGTGDTEQVAEGTLVKWQDGGVPGDSAQDHVTARVRVTETEDGETPQGFFQEAGGPGRRGRGGGGEKGARGGREEEGGGETEEEPRGGRGGAREGGRAFLHSNLQRLEHTKWARVDCHRERS